MLQQTRHPPPIAQRLASMLGRFFSYVRSHIVRRVMVCVVVLSIIAILASNWFVPTIGHQSATGGYYADLFFVNGVLVHERMDFRTKPSDHEEHLVFKMRTASMSRRLAYQEYFNWGTLGFLFTRVNVGSGERIMADLIILPLWPVPFVLMVILLLGYRRHYHRNKLQFEGLCPVCGYDLRASPERCPECGTARHDDL